ncbi:DUF6088 family protein [Acidaminobacter sp.]|uniref:DUF6088 family protein n=1 Tax=Acidaminobacter sp. TaxID=1872102 RepID=UPI00255E1D3C|nr:DUF6088 family protein [Acidaminobacter sp.]MDK9711152.1 DUF6088 family protein [Acidaminobacter sp.]
MEREFILYKIRARILEADKGEIFIVSDFKDLGDIKSVGKALSRLCDEGLIRRIMRGLYEYPQYSDYMGDLVAPSPERVALAIARKYSWRIIPDGNIALNLLGLSTQVPSTWTFASNGPYREFELGKTKIKFVHVALKEISNMTYKTALVVRALKALGEEHVNDKNLIILSRKIEHSEWDNLLRETKYTTAWIYNAIKNAFSIGGHDEGDSKTKYS